ncbi:MAG: exodeoxyribonuclease VII small subunit [Deltaproteobacteria bacterium]|nr:exodeoxyribonuclease VII small subunit [Deltaproteobacteria bacterium]
MTDQAESFEVVLGRLQGLVQKLEGGELTLEESLATFEEGVRLARTATERLDAAERRVEVLLKDSSVQEFTAPDGK